MWDAGSGKWDVGSRKWEVRSEIWDRVGIEQALSLLLPAYQRSNYSNAERMRFNDVCVRYCHPEGIARRIF